jgi:hypothetical protein
MTQVNVLGLFPPTPIVKYRYCQTFEKGKVNGRVADVDVIVFSHSLELACKISERQQEGADLTSSDEG